MKRRVNAITFLLPAIACALAPAAYAASQSEAAMLKEVLVEETAAAIELPADTLGNTAPEELPKASGSGLPQVKVTPVDIDREKPEEPAMHYYDKHGNPLQTPVRFLAELDTVTKVKSGPKYRAFGGVSIGANFFDGILMIVGQKRANFDIGVDCSIHNWFFPVVEAGVGFSNAWPDDGRCNFKVSPAFYARVGMNYNFLYKSSPDYQVYLGLRAGFTNFSYDILNISPGSDYYTEKGPKEMTGLKSTAFYGQVLAGLKVKIYKCFSMGWSVRYGFRFKQIYSDEAYPAWFTPGFGTATPISATFSLIFTIGSPKPSAPAVK